MLQRTTEEEGSKLLTLTLCINLVYLPIKVLETCEMWELACRGGAAWEQELIQLADLAN